MSPVFPRSGRELAGGFAVTGAEVLGTGREILPPVDSPDEPPQPAAIIAPDKKTINSPPRIIFLPSHLIAFFMASGPALPAGPIEMRSAAACIPRDPSHSETSLRPRGSAPARPS